LPAEWVVQLERMRTAPIARWTIDIWISHKPPQRYPTFPYRGVIRVDRDPLFIIGRSMAEVHRIPPDWTRRIARQVDEVWIPSTQGLSAFVEAGVNPAVLQVVPEPIDAALYDPFVTQPMQLQGMRKFNFLSIFKMEERKGFVCASRAALCLLALIFHSDRVSHPVVSWGLDCVDGCVYAWQCVCMCVNIYVCVF